MIESRQFHFIPELVPLITP